MERLPLGHAVVGHGHVGLEVFVVIVEHPDEVVLASVDARRSEDGRVLEPRSHLQLARELRSVVHAPAMLARPQRAHVDQSHHLRVPSARVRYSASHLYVRLFVLLNKLLVLSSSH